jgi:hypothetical protein
MLLKRLPHDWTPVMWTLLCTCFALYFYFEEVKTMEDNMAAVLSVLCDGNLEFVASEHHTFLTPYIFPTSEYWNADSEEGSRIRRKLVEVSSSHEALLQSVQEVLAKSKENSSWSLSQTSYAVFYDSILLTRLELNLSPYEADVYYSGCADALNEWPGDFAVLKVTYSITDQMIQDCTDSGSCADSVCPLFQSYCSDSTAIMLRRRCASTCNCSMPRTGMFYASSLFGCPSGCSNKNTVIAAKAALPCTDVTAQQINEDGTFRKYVEELAGFEKSYLRSAWGGVPVERIISEGCGIFDGAYTSKDMRDNYAGVKGWVAEVMDSTTGMNPKIALCQGKPAFISMADFCPDACGCTGTDSDSSECPSTCSSSTTSNTTG